MAGKHRADKARRTPKKALKSSLKTSLTLSSMAVAGTVIAVGSGSLSLGAHSGAAPTPTANVADLGAAAVAHAAGSTAAQGAQDASDLAAAEADRAQAPVTRSDTRAAADPAKTRALALGAGNTMARSENLADQDPRTIARALLSSYGWDESQFGCLESLWDRESHWNPHAANPSSGAYGIPQALPGSKMASAGSDWQSNPVTQIKWGLGYIADRYGSPCGAWGHSQGHGWY